MTHVYAGMTTEELKAKEKELVSHYDGNPQYYSSNSSVVFERTGQKVEGKKILDLGCGDGRLSRQLKGYESYTGVDYSEVRVKKATEDAVKERKNNVHFFASDLTDFLDIAVDGLQTFDVICAFEVLEHLANPKEVLQKARMVATEAVCGSVPINMPYVAHLQLFKTIDDVVALIGEDAVFTVSEGHVFFRIKI